MSVHEWLNMGLVGGDGANANMILKGPLDSFPSKMGKVCFILLLILIMQNYNM